MQATEFIPRIWADTILASLQKSLIIDRQQYEEMQREHEWRMSNDPVYARTYAENEAESYWLALYENQLPESEEDDEW